MGDLFDISKINAVKECLANAGETIAAAESVTAGMLQLALSSADLAAAYFQGGITTYNLGQKARHLRVNPIHAVSCNCVSAQVAAEMALHVCQLFTSDWGIGITGYASPMPEAGNQVFCYFAIACRGKIVISKKITGEGDTPVAVQQLYVAQVIDTLHKHLCG